MFVLQFTQPICFLTGMEGIKDGFGEYAGVLDSWTVKSADRAIKASISPDLMASRIIFATCSRTLPFLLVGPMGVCSFMLPTWERVVHVDIVKENKLSLVGFAGINDIAHKRRPRFLPNLRVVGKTNRDINYFRPFNSI